MLDVSLDINLDGIVDDVSEVMLRQVPYAAYLALNETVFKTSVDLRKKTLPYFIQGGPVAFTKRGVQYKKAKSKRELVASVFIPDAQWKYMMWVVDGGTKRWGRSRHGIGVPIQENMRFNKYGNIPGRKRKEKLWREILNRGGGVTATPLQGQLGKNEFIGKSKGGIVGLWKRTGPDGRGKPILKVYFTHEGVPYSQSVPFAAKARLFGQKRFRKAFNKKLQQVVEREAKRLQVR